MYHPISSKIENYSAPDRWLQFMYSNLELFWVKKAPLVCSSRGADCKQNYSVYSSSLRKQINLSMSNSSQDPSKRMLKNSFAPDFSLGCDVCGGIHREFLAAVPKYSWTLPVGAHQHNEHLHEHHRQPPPPCSNLWFNSNNRGGDVLWQTVGLRHKHHSITRLVTRSNFLPFFHYCGRQPKCLGTSTHSFFSDLSLTPRLWL